MSDKLTTLKSELRERTDLLFSYALKAKELEAALAAAQERNANKDFQIADMRAELNEAQVEIARLREGQKIHNCEAAEAQIVELEKDAAILDWMADNNLLEGFVHVDYDVHEVAIWIAEERDADAEPTVEDYRLALRRLIRAAIDEEHQYIKDLQGEEAAIREEVK